MTQLEIKALWKKKKENSLLSCEQHDMCEEPRGLLTTVTKLKKKIIFTDLGKITWHTIPGKNPKASRPPQTNEAAECGCTPWR